MQKLYKLFLVIILIALWYNSYSQVVSYRTTHGAKANYSIEIPSNYSPKEAIGRNVDLKYVNSEGTSIVVVVAPVNNGSSSEVDIEEMMNISDEKWKDMLESRGMENVTIIKRGILKINGVKSYFTYHKNSELYFHAIMQIRDNKFVTLTITCFYKDKGLNLAMINRVVNSLK